MALEERWQKNHRIPRISTHTPEPICGRKLVNITRFNELQRSRKHFPSMVKFYMIQSAKSDNHNLFIDVI